MRIRDFFLNIFCRFKYLLFLCSMKNKNFHIVRHYLNGNIKFSVNLTEEQAELYEDYFLFSYENEDGGLTYWYQIDIEPSQELIVDEDLPF